jgi:ABC-type branched-subunit amino acid transport system ATPase component
MGVVFSIVQKIAVLHQGRLIADGAPVRADPEVRRVYLGEHWPALLTIDDIHTAYGLSRVLFGVSVEVNAGECVALLGRNGVGKTTTMRSVMGLTPPASGRVTWKGKTSPVGRRTGWPAQASDLFQKTAAFSLS